MGLHYTKHDGGKVAAARNDERAGATWTGDETAFSSVIALIFLHGIAPAKLSPMSLCQAKACPLFIVRR